MFHMIKHATSRDGYKWKRDGKVVIQPRMPNMLLQAMCNEGL